MIDKLDEIYKKDNGISIFENPNLTWFDPASGIGNFQVIAYQKLMKGLGNVIKDEEKRRKHIMEKMIYVSELNKKNVEAYKKIFCGDGYALNINQGDTLELDIKDKWGVDGFDVVMGNPPY